MGKETKILYCDSSDNPVVGCSGCELYSDDPAKNRCYASTLVRRYAGCKGWPKSFNEPAYFDHRIPQALSWKDLTGTDRPGKPWLNGYPRIIFVNDLSDGFCPGGVAPETWLEPHLAAMAKSPHIWMLLTKWPGRMRKFFDNHPIPDNFWLGTSVLRQSNMWRVDQLLQMDAKVRFVSAEPLLGALDFSQNGGPLDVARIYGVNWVAAGGESGTNARPMHPGWIRSLRDQCIDSGTPFCLKQWGEWVPNLPEAGYHNPPNSGERWGTVDIEGNWFPFTTAWTGDRGKYEWPMVKAGKHKAGRSLDGQLWNQMPEWK